LLSRLGAVIWGGYFSESSKSLPELSAARTSLMLKLATVSAKAAKTLLWSGLKFAIWLMLCENKPNFVVSM
jgi:hypothetical protein